MTVIGRRGVAAGLLLMMVAAGGFQLRDSRPLRGFFSEMAYSRNAQREHQWGEWFRWTQFVRRVTPPDTLLVIPSPPSLSAPRSVAWYMSHAGLDGYLLFPRRIIHVGESPPPDPLGPIYHVSAQEYTGSRFVDHPRQDWERSLVQVRPRMGTPQTPLRDFSEVEPRPWPLALGVFKLALLMASGLLLTLRYFEPRSLTGLATTAFLVATVQATVVFLVADLVRIPMTEWTQLLWMSGLAWLGLRQLARRRERLGRQAPADWRFCLGGALVCAFFGLLFVKAVTMPISGFDGIAIWGPKAKAIVAQHALRGYGRWGSGPSCPPLLPIAMAQVALGGEAAVNLLFPLFGLAIYATCYDELHKIVRSATLRALLPLLLFLAPRILEHTLIAYANLALCAFIIRAVVILPRALREDRPNDWVALAILLSGAVLVRHEGIIHVGYLGVIVGLWGMRHRAAVRRVGYLLMWPAAAWVAWGAYAAWILHAEAFSVPRPLWTWDTAWAMIHGTTRGILAPGDWGVLTVGFLGCCLILRPRLVARHEVPCLYLLFVLVGLSAFAMGAIPVWGAATYFNTGFNRYVMPAVLVMALILIKELGRALSAGEAGA